MKTLREDILDISRQNTIGELSPWFDAKLDEFIKGDNTLLSNPIFLNEEELLKLRADIVWNLKKYSKQTNISTAIIGMSGGVDSALTAALFKEAGWHVIGVTIPIHQEPEETERGKEACEALKLEHRHVDLTGVYEEMIMMVGEDWTEDNKASRIRRGNIRARLRMITLYNMAAAHGGLVASTDNYSELAIGFWTRFGDEGDLAPIRGLLKSWEVPMLAQLSGVPEEIWRAKPTDGLGVADGDEAQFGMSYLELDLMLLSMLITNADYRFYDEATESGGVTLNKISTHLNINNDLRAQEVFIKLTDRMGTTWFKRYGTIQLLPALINHRFNDLDSLDKEVFNPKGIQL